MVDGIMGVHIVRNWCRVWKWWKWSNRHLMMTIVHVDSAQQGWIWTQHKWRHRLWKIDETHLTFRGQYIVICSYNKSQQDALFLKFILIKNKVEK